MSDFDRPGATLPGPVKQRPKGSRFANLGDRLARTFGGYERGPEDHEDWDAPEDFAYADEPELPAWDPVGPRFPIARLGYDRDTVDEHVAGLERELADLQTRAPSADVVSAEIEKLGEQTSAILNVAHDQAHEMTRQAQEQADRCLADAASNAVMITEDAKRRLRQLDSDTDAVWRERARLVEDVRSVSAALAALADDAVARFPAEPDRSDSERSRPERSEPEHTGSEHTRAERTDVQHIDAEHIEHEHTAVADPEPSDESLSGSEPPSPDGKATMRMPSVPDDDQPWFGT
jgi:cell division septum initiation protein DivIVA